MEHQKCLIYCRISSVKQDIDGTGLGSQEHRCRAYAEDKGYKVEEVFTDKKTGGVDFMEREGMVKLLAYLRRHRKTSYVVIFDDLKRYARNVMYHWALRQEMDKYGAKLECLNYRFEDTPEGKFFETMMAAQGELERDQGGRQTIQKMRARMEQGYFVFQAPIGYRYEKTKEHGKILVPDEPHASIIREALEGYSMERFQTQAEIKHFLDNHPNYHKGSYGKVHYQRIHELLTRPIYAGFVEHERWGITLRKGKHEPLIDVATYQRNQDRLEGKAKVPARKNLQELFPLRGWVVCCECNHPMTASSPKGKYKHYQYYLCQQKGCSSYGKSSPKEKVESSFEELLRSVLPSKQVLMILEDMFKKTWEYRRQNQKQSQEALKMELVDVEKKAEKLVDMMIDAQSDTTVKTLEKRLNKLEREKALLSEKIEKLGQPLRPFEEMTRTSLDFVRNPYKVWASGVFANRRAVLNLVFDTPFAYSRNSGPRTPQTTSIFKALSDFSHDNFRMVPRRGLEPPRPYGH